MPEAEDSRGISDRHHAMTMPDAIWSLDVLDAAIERPNPHDQVAWLRKVEFESLSGNLESSLYVWHVDIKGQKIKRFEHGALLVRDVDEDQMGTRKVLQIIRADNEHWPISGSSTIHGRVRVPEEEGILALTLHQL